MFKKTLAMLLCVVLMLSLATVAFADEPVVIKVEAEAATEKQLNQTVLYDYKNDPILWDGKNTHEVRPVGDDGYHYVDDNKDLGMINICPKDTYTYTFEVETAGTYTFGVSGTSDRATPFTIYVDGSETAETKEKTHIDAPGLWPPVEADVHTLHLTKGTHTFKISIDEIKNHNFGADYFYLKLATADAEPDPEPGVTPTAEILKGTATIDGVLDEAYKNSFSISVDKSSVIWVPKGDPDDVKTTVYFMHDGEYLYICGVVTGDSAIVNTNPANPGEWAVDGLDIWFLLPELPLRTKFTMDAFALPYIAETATGEGLKFGNGEGSHNLDVTKIEKAAVRGEGTYVVEAKLPIPYYSESEGTLAINVQLNNVYDAGVNANVGESNCGFYGKQFSAEVLDATVVSLSDTAAEGPKDPVQDPDNAGTGDMISVIVALAAVSAAGAAIVLKKKEF